jgi:Enoyl-(Acyl carrier protein) reductase/Plasmid encoded RepA protein
MIEAQIWCSRLRDEELPFGKMENMIVLSHEFYKEITDHPIPTDLKAAKALSSAPAALDLYTWLTYRCFSAKGEESVPLFGEFGLVNQLGIGAYARPRKFREQLEQWLLLVKARMKRVRKGSIVLTASTNSFDGEADLIAYNASKAGLLGILRTAANELGPYGIRINAVCPGLIRTRLTASSFSNPNVISDYFKHLALGRGGEPDEVAEAVMFLASDWASYITGTTLVVDGGQMASKFGTWGKETDKFDGQRWTRDA